MVTATIARATDEQLRRLSSRLTKVIARRAGGHYGMLLCGGYPKSGTVWLCNLLSNYLGIPHPQNYSLPIAMSAILHNHWLYDRSFPPAAYVIRDGRDVMVSLYFYNMQAIAEKRHPRQAQRLHLRYKRLFGPAYDPLSIENNLPKFIEAEMTNPIAFRGVTWPQHVDSWCHTPHPRVAVTRYEDLRADTGKALSHLLMNLGQEVDERRVTMAVARNSFDLSGRAPGVEDRTDFMRKGISGDWRTYFTRESSEIFEGFAGAALRRYGYESDPQWYKALT